jgi:hypothetical protein
MKRIVEKRSNEGCASPPECPAYLIPLSVCLSILCPFCISHHCHLGPVRFSNNRNEKKFAPGFHYHYLSREGKCDLLLLDDLIHH